jgi:putative membrane protein
MTRHLMIAGVCALALSLGACNKNNGTADANTAANATPDAHPAATIPTPANETNAQDYVTKAANADMMEVEAGKVAGERAASSDVKAFAKEMVAAHTKTTADLKSALKTANLTLTPPSALPGDMADTINDLKTVDAKAFDKKYMDLMVDAHQDALDLQTRYAKDGDNAQLKAFAASVAQKVQEHLTKAKTIRDALK